MIRKIKADDKEDYIKMAKEFYSTDAVMHPIPEENFERTFDELMRSDKYISAYIFEYNGEKAGYALTANFFSQEAGGMVLWIDEIYIIQKFRGKGIGAEFFKYIDENIGDYKRIRLEVEDYNKNAVSLYKKNNFDFMPYEQMYKEL